MRIAFWFVLVLLVACQCRFDMLFCCVTRVRESGAAETFVLCKRWRYCRRWLTAAADENYRRRRELRRNREKGARQFDRRRATRIILDRNQGNDQRGKNLAVAGIWNSLPKESTSSQKHHLN